MSHRHTCLPGPPPPLPERAGPVPLGAHQCSVSAPMSPPTLACRVLLRPDQCCLQYATALRAPKTVEKARFDVSAPHGRVLLLTLPSYVGAEAPCTDAACSPRCRCP